MKRMRRLIPPLALILNACHPFKHSKPCGNCRQHIPTDENVRGPAPLTSDQSFRLESGRDLPVFTRFEEPITVRVTGSTPQSLGSDLTKIAAPIADRSEYHHQSYFRKRASKYDDSSGKPRKNSTHIATCCMFCCS